MHVVPNRYCSISTAVAEVGWSVSDWKCRLTKLLKHLSDAQSFTDNVQPLDVAVAILEEVGLQVEQGVKTAVMCRMRRVVLPIVCKSELKSMVDNSQIWRSQVTKNTSDSV